MLGAFSDVMIPPILCSSSCATASFSCIGLLRRLGCCGLSGCSFGCWVDCCTRFPPVTLGSSFCFWVCIGSSCWSCSTNCRCSRCCANCCFCVNYCFARCCFANCCYAKGCYDCSVHSCCSNCCLVKRCFSGCCCINCCFVNRCCCRCRSSVNES